MASFKGSRSNRPCVLFLKPLLDKERPYKLNCQPSGTIRFTFEALEVFMKTSNFYLIKITPETAFSPVASQKFNLHSVTVITFVRQTSFYHCSQSLQLGLHNWPASEPFRGQQETPNSPLKCQFNLGHLLRYRCAHQLTYGAWESRRD